MSEVTELLDQIEAREANGGPPPVIVDNEMELTLDDGRGRIVTFVCDLSRLVYSQLATFHQRFKAHFPDSLAKIDGTGDLVQQVAFIVYLVGVRQGALSEQDEGYVLDCLTMADALRLLEALGKKTQPKAAS